MGADIYLNSAFEASKAQYQPIFDAAVEARNRKLQELGNVPLDHPTIAPLQEKVTDAYEALFSTGYFRDSYNDSNFLWTRDLSWWADVGEMLDGEGYLPIDKTKELRERILAAPALTTEFVREHVEARRKRNADNGWGEFKPASDEDVEAWREFWVEQQEKLIALIDQSIALDEPLLCSV